MTYKVACAHSRHDDQDDNKMSTLAFINFLLVKIFLTLIWQSFPPSKIFTIQYVINCNYKVTSFLTPLQVTISLIQNIKLSQQEATKEQRFRL